MSFFQMFSFSQNVFLDFSNKDFDPANSCVFNRAALSATSTERIESLAQPKMLYSGYTFPYPMARPITGGAKNAVASERVQILALPRGKK